MKESRANRWASWAMLMVCSPLILVIASNYNWPVRDWLRAMGGVL